MERNQAVSRALLNQLDEADITELDEFSAELWGLINSSVDQSYFFELIDDGGVPFDFFVRLFVKMGFSCEDAARLVMRMHKDGGVVLASAQEYALLDLQAYINTQAGKQELHLLSQIQKINIIP